jgi:hypothetical protein
MLHSYSNVNLASQVHLPASPLQLSYIYPFLQPSKQVKRHCSLVVLTLVLKGFIRSSGEGLVYGLILNFPCFKVAVCSNGNSRHLYSQLSTKCVGESSESE